MINDSKSALTTEVICKNCETSFLKNNRYIGRSINHFCSKSCAAKYNNTIHKHKYVKCVVENCIRGRVDCTTRFCIEHRGYRSKTKNEDRWYESLKEEHALIIKNNFNKGVIYKFTSPSGRCYVGQTTNLKERYRSHHRNDSSNTMGIRFLRAIKKYGGIENFKLDILWSTQIIDDIIFLKKCLDKLEIFFIEKHKAYTEGYNSTKGGKGVYGIIFSDISREKLKNSQKGKERVERLNFICPICDTPFKLRPADYNKKLRQNKNPEIVCSKKCNGKLHK